MAAPSSPSEKTSTSALSRLASIAIWSGAEPKTVTVKRRSFGNAAISARNALPAGVFQSSSGCQGSVGGNMALFPSCDERAIRLVDEPVFHATILREHFRQPDVARRKMPRFLPEQNPRCNARLAPFV